MDIVSLKAGGHFVSCRNPFSRHQAFSDHLVDVFWGEIKKAKNTEKERGGKIQVRSERNSHSPVSSGIP